MQRVELLSPAKDLAIGIAAINNGADAVYIGAPSFGARKSASNSVEDIEALVKYAHKYYCRVFVALNTVLYDHELAEAEKMIWQLYEIGVDALIVQDMGILRMDLPPICLHASTQMHNYDLERIKFLDSLGFQRIVLARELSLEQIREIRKAVKAELEVFVHGALCVSLSGQCYLSHYMFGRSANRGECAQPCRMKWWVKDSAGKSLVNDKYILSLKDLNLSSYIDSLIEIGVESFKIEGRMKDENYVANVTSHYSSLLNGQKDGQKTIQRVGSGKSVSSFTSDPERSFSRGVSTYFIDKRERGLVNQDTPKSVGKYIGTVSQVKHSRVRISTKEQLNNGDGLCYLENGVLKGIKVNGVDGDWVLCNDIPSVKLGTELYRNYDHRFVKALEKAKSVRKIGVSMQVQAKEGHLLIECRDEDGVVVDIQSEELFEKANNPSQQERLKQQLIKCGDTDYICDSIEYLSEDVLFVPAVSANALRRILLEKLTEERELKRSKLEPFTEDKAVMYPTKGDWHLNIVNQKAKAFYAEHGVQDAELGFEKSKSQQERDLMQSRYCILYELGRCNKNNKNTDIQFPLYIYNDKHKFRLEFDCKECFMKLI